MEPDGFEPTTSCLHDRYFFFGNGASRSEFLSTADVDRAGVQIRPSPFETQPKPRGTAFPA